MRLGAHFSSDMQAESLERQYRAGTIFRLFCNFTAPPKDKYLLLLCTDPDPIFFFINSKIGNFYANKGDLRDLHVQILRAEYSFLSHDSFIDCNQPIEVFAREEILAQVRAHPDRIVGTLSENGKVRVSQAIQDSRILERRLKNRLVFALGSGTQ